MSIARKLGVRSDGLDRSYYGHMEMMRPRDPQGETRHLAEFAVKASSGPMAAGMARHALDGLDVHLSAEMFAAVRLLVTELVTNSLRHANLAEEDQVELAVAVTDEDVRLEVADPGAGFDPQTREGALEREGGWGLYLVDCLADRWGVTREPQTTVWLEMDLEPLAATG